MQKVVVLNSEGINVVEVEQVGLKTMYKYIECRNVDVVGLPKEIDVWVDDEGLFVSKNKVYEINITNMPALHLAGNMLFASLDDEGNSIGLSREQLNWLAYNMSVKPYGLVK